MARINKAVWIGSIVLACAGTAEAVVGSAALGASQSDESAVSAPEATVTRCVRTADGLRAALAAAAANGKHDVIRLTQGTYYGPFVYESTEAFDLRIEGGYTGGCASRVVNPANTLLECRHGWPPESVLRLATEQAANFVIEGMTVQSSERGFCGYGGALWARTAGEIVLNRNVVQYQFGEDVEGAVGANLAARKVNVENTRITRNEANDVPVSGVAITALDVEFRGNDISDNWQHGYSEYFDVVAIRCPGGGSCAGKVTVANNTIIENRAEPCYGCDWQAWSLFGHSLSIEGYGEVVFVNNLVAGNALGGARIRAGVVYAVNNTIAGNWCWGCEGGLLIDSRNQASIYNNIIGRNMGWRNDYDYNQIDTPGQNLYIGGPGEVFLFNNDFTSGWYDTVIERAPSYTGSNLDVDPLFVDYSWTWHWGDLGNLHLQPTSPVINVGSNAAPRLPVRDLDGNPRIRLGTVDMGAYEAPNPAPSAPRNPSPASGVTNVSLEPTLTWTQGTRATSHDVYFGTTSSPPLVRNTDGTSFRPGTLTTNTTYYWRIVAKNDFGTASSPTWSFKTGNLGATAPSPAKGASGVSLTAMLTWKAGLGATSYDVYFGTTSPPPKVGSTTGTSYNPGTLAANKTYYWKVVTRMGSNSLSSPIWTFKTK